MSSKPKPKEKHEISLRNKLHQGLSLLHKKLYCFSPPNIPQNCAHSRRPKKTTFLFERWMEEELPDHQTDILLTSKRKIKLLKEVIPHKSYMLALLEKVIQIFFRLPTKDTAPRAYKQRHLSHNHIRRIHTPKQNFSRKELNILWFLFVEFYL